jgi:hypothetical protein
MRAEYASLLFPVATACSRGRGTVATARSIAILYSQNAVMRTLGRVPIQLTMGLRHLRLNSRSYLPRVIPSLTGLERLNAVES